MITLRAGHEIMTRPNSMSELQWIEKIARTCYKSEDKISGDGESAKALVSNLIKRQHYAMIEHASIILKMDYSLYLRMKNLASLINEVDDMSHTYLKFSAFDGRFIVSGNMRAWLDFLTICNNKCYQVPDAVLFAISGAGEYHEFMESRMTIFNNVINFDKVVNAEYPLDRCEEIERYELASTHEMLVHFPVTIKWTCDRGVSHELVRHRDASFAQESTRYCNYSKDKYGNECTFIDLSPGMELDRVVANLPEGIKSEIYRIWSDAMLHAEDAYIEMIKLGATPQIARSVLPNSVKTEVVMTATLDEWVKFFSLRLPDAAHPQMREITHEAVKEMRELFPTIID